MPKSMYARSVGSLQTSRASAHAARRKRSRNDTSNGRDGGSPALGRVDGGCGTAAAADGDSRRGSRSGNSNRGHGTAANDDSRRGGRSGHGYGGELAATDGLGDHGLRGRRDGDGDRGEVLGLRDDRGFACYGGTGAADGNGHG